MNLWGAGRLSLGAAEREALRLERMLVIARFTPLAVTVNVATAMIVAAVRWEAERTGLIVLWLGLVIFAGLLRVWCSRKWLSREGAPAPGRADLRNVVVALTLAGLAWGIASFLLVPIGDGKGLLFIASIAVAFAAASIPSSMAVPHAARGFLLAAMIPVTLRFAAEGEAHELIQAGMCVVLSFFLLWFLRASHANFVVGVTAKLRSGRLADELAATQARLVGAIESTSEGFALYDAEGRLVLCNDVYREFYDLPPEVTVPGTPVEAIVRAALPAVSTAAERASLEAWMGRPIAEVDRWVEERVARLRGTAGELFEQRLPDGRWLRSCYRRMSDGGSVVLHVDITALKSREGALERAEGEYRSLFENSVVGVYRSLPDGRPLRVNSAMARLLGFRSEAELLDVVADARTSYVEPDRRAAFVAALLREGRVTEFVSEIRRVDTGERLWVSENAWVVPAANGEPLCFEGTMLDVTARKRAEEALGRARTAEEASRLKSEFLANMSHELRTPLNAVIGFSEAMLAGLGGTLDDRGRGYVRDINESGRHLLDLINDILDLSKIEAGKLELDEEPVSLAEIATSSERFIAQRARDAGVTIVNSIDAGLPPVRGDERRLRQILLNLLSNAVKFTPAGGTVTIEASPRPGGGIEVLVADTGIGMRPEDIPLALEAFRQVDGALDRRFEGTGLGLPLVRSLAELHGGGLRLDSAPGAGTRATVWLPPQRVLEPATLRHRATLPAGPRIAVGG